MRLIRLPLLALAVALAACNVGSSSDDEDVVDEGSTQGGDEIVVLCTARFVVTGTVTPDPNAPALEGCVPDGTWTLNVALDTEDPGDCVAEDVVFNAQYVYEVTRDAEDQLTMTYLGSDGSPDDLYKTGASGGTCRANIEHIPADGSSWLMLQAFENEPGVLNGQGEFELFDLM